MPTCRSTRSWPTQGIKAEDIPVVAFSVGEEELAGIDTGPLVGHLAAWNYFHVRADPDAERRLHRHLARAYIGDEKRVTNDPMEAHYIGFNMWVKAVEKAGTTDRGCGHRFSIVGVSVPNLTGGYSAMMPNHHITKPVLIGEIQDDGQFETVYETPGLVVGDAWSDFLAGLQGPDRRLAQADELRELQHRHRQVRRVKGN